MALPTNFFSSSGGYTPKTAADYAARDLGYKGDFTGTGVYDWYNQQMPNKQFNYKGGTGSFEGTFANAFRGYQQRALGGGDSGKFTELYGSNPYSSPIRYDVNPEISRAYADSFGWEDPLGSTYTGPAYNTMAAGGSVAPYQNMVLPNNPNPAPDTSYTPAMQAALKNAGLDPVTAQPMQKVSVPMQSAGAYTPPPPSASGSWNVDTATAIGRQFGLLAPNEVAQGGLLDSRVAAASPQVQQQFNAARSSIESGQYPDNGGVVPLGLFEDLNDAQKQALDQIIKGAPQNPYASDISSTIQRLLASIGGSTGTFDPITGTAAYMNPYTQQVIDTTTKKTKDEAEALRNNIRSRAAKLGNTGSSAEGVQLSNVDSSLLDTLANINANYGYRGYDDALTRSRQDFDSRASRNAQAASLYGNALGLLNNQYATNTDDYYRRAGATLGAGETIQNNNQKLLEAINRYRAEQLGFPYSQLDFLKGILGSYPTGSNTTSSTGGNGLNGLLGGALAGSRIGNLFSMNSDISSAISSNPSIF